jgi:hypothetical protein
MAVSSSIDGPSMRGGADLRRGIDETRCTIASIERTRRHAIGRNF